MSLNMNDAVVAMRSFGRRYGEVVNGPIGDDAWARKVRAVQPRGHSALAYVGYATDSLSALAKAIGALPTIKEPTLLLPSISEPTTETDAKAMVLALKSAGTDAAAALEARSHDDYHRPILVNANAVELRELVANVVAECVDGLKLAQRAIDNAK